MWKRQLLVVTHLLALGLGVLGYHEVNKRIPDNAIALLQRKNAGFRNTIQRQRNRNLELEATLADVAAQLERRTSEDRANLQRIGNLETEIAGLRESNERLAALTGEADTAIRDAIGAVDGIETIIGEIEDRATGGD